MRRWSRALQHDEPHSLFAADRLRQDLAAPKLTASHDAAH
jgi:hypothetical protein